VTRVLAVNAGSSSLKTALFQASHPGPERLLSLAVPRLDLGEMTIASPGEQPRSVVVVGDALDAVLAEVERWSTGRGEPLPDVVAHRFVHGGPTLVAPTRLEPAALATLQALVPWAPLHQPAALVGVEHVRERWPDAEQIGCFDTAFHGSLPEVAARLPLPDWTWRAGVRRYGFHGLSCQHVVDQLGAVSLGRGVIAHLGNGTSLTAVLHGRSVDTTMGFTPDGGGGDGQQDRRPRPRRPPASAG
jgi:acetate kinase